MISRHMQMRVHGLALVGILLTQAHVLDRVPCTGERLEIAVFLLWLTDINQNHRNT